MKTLKTLKPCNFLTFQTPKTSKSQQFEICSMKNRKAIILLKHFSKKELLQFSKFLESPFFNESKQISSLFTYLQQFAPTFESAKLTSQKAHQYVFKNKSYSENNITKLLSKLFKLIEQFIIHNDLKNKELQGRLSLIHFYNERMNPKHFTTLLQQIRRLQAKTPYQDYAFYEVKVNIEREANIFYSKIDNRQGDVNFQALNNAFDEYYLVNKLIVLCQMINRQHSVNIDYYLSLKEEIITYIPSSPYKDSPVIALWYQALLLLQQPDNIAFYEKLKTLLEGYSDLLQPIERRVLYTYLENAASRVKTVREAYYQEVFELYNIQLDKGIIYRDGYLLPALFKNIVTVALQLQKFDWTAQFIEEHKMRIPAELQTDVYNYNLANLHFHQKKYDRALILLQQIEYKDAFIKLSVKRILIKIYYELREWDVLEASLNAFRVFIHRHQQIAKSHKKAHQQFINFLYRMIKILPNDREKIRQLHEEIEKEQLLPEKNWLLGKITDKIEH